MRCARCGREVEVGAICGRCLSEKEEIARIDGFEIELCPKCGFVKVGGRWENVGVEGAIKHNVMRNLTVREEYDVEDVEIVAGNNDGYIRLRGKLLGDEISTTLHFTFKVKRQTCVRCSREAGGYYESIVQLRADGREVEEDEIETAMQIVESVLAKGQGNDKMFLSKVERRKEGVDFYLGGRDAGRKISSMIARELGGNIKSSRKIHGRGDGRELYRFTYLVRLPAYRKGDVVEKGKRFYVVKNQRDGKGVEILTGKFFNISDGKVVARRGELEEGTVVNLDDSVVEILRDDGVLVRTERGAGMEMGARVRIFEVNGKYYSFSDDIC